MTKPKYIFSVAAFFLVFLLCSIDSFGQAPNKPQAEPSYEVVLQVLTASNAANDKSSVPQTLSNVIKKLKTNYSFSNYRVASTYLQRVASTGNMEFKGVLNEPNQNVFTPVFSEWKIDQLLTLPDAKGQDSISMRGFRFGQRIPIKTGVLNDGEKGNAVVNYEQIGLTISRLNLLMNTPTVIGNLSALKSDELTFLILTVKPED